MLSKLAEFFFFGFTPLLVGALMMPGLSFGADETLTGEVTYRERIALPPNAVVEVELVDVSRADAPAAIIAAQTIESGGQVPIPFSLSFDPAVIRKGATYALQGRIIVDGQLWFVSDARHSVDPLSAGARKMLVLKRAGNQGAG